MVADVKSTITVAAPTASVHATLRDVAHYPQWASPIGAVDVLAVDDDGAVARARVALVSPVGTLNATLTFHHVDDGIRFELVEGDMLELFDANAQIVDHHDETCRVDANLQAAASSPMVPEALLASYAQHVVDELLEALRAHCEGGEAAGEGGNTDGA